MTNWKAAQSAIREIVVALGAGEATVEQYELLDSLLIEHDQAAEYFAVLMEQEASLHDATRNTAVISHRVAKSLTVMDRQREGLIRSCEADESSLSNDVFESSDWQGEVVPANLTPGTVPSIRFVVSHGAVALAAVVLLILTGWLSFNSSNTQLFLGTERDNAISQMNGKSASTQLVAMSRCIWDDAANEGPSIGQMISAGRSLSLVEGIAEFDAGLTSQQSASVRVSGPATVFISQDGLPELAHGLMTLRTQDLLAPLSFPTPAGYVAISEHASLGIAVEGEMTSIHVFQGTVEIQRPESLAAADGNSSRTKLGVGEAITFHAGLKSGTDSPKRSDALPEQFAFTRSLDAGKLLITDEYRRAVLASNPAIYWQFEDRLSRDFANSGEDKELYGKLRGAATTRSFGNNHVLEFGLTPTVGAVVSEQLWPSQKLDSYTVELWMKASHFHYSAVIGLVDPKPDKTKRQKHGFFFGLTGPSGIHADYFGDRANALRFIHRSPAAREGGAECISPMPYSVREWQHIVLRKSDEQLDLLLNGEVIDSTRDAAPLPANLRLVVGQLYATLDERTFTGQVDEIALYNHALSDDEIKRHYLLIKEPKVSDAFL